MLKTPKRFTLKDKLRLYRDFIEYQKSKLIKANYEPKVICIGFNKTGTTSLGYSLRMLGYKHCKYNSYVALNLYKDDGDFTALMEYASKFQSFDDKPWNQIEIIQLLDKTFPNSQFIYLHREEQDWKKSYKNWIKKKMNLEANVEYAYKQYTEHQNFVNNYFVGEKAKQLISLSINDLNGFAKLARFLKKPIFQKHFPHLNKT